MLQYLNNILNNTFLKNVPKSVLAEGLLHAHIKRLKNGSILYMENDTDDTNLYFIVSGALRGYFEYDGKEISSMYFVKNTIVANISAIYARGSSWLTLQAAMPTLLLYIKKDYFFSVLEKHPRLNVNVFEVLTNSMFSYERRLRYLLCYPAKERYLEFRKDFSEHEKYFKSQDIASYLSITPETLSRIKKEIDKQQ